MVSNHLDELRLQRGWTKSELARRADLTLGTVSRALNGVNISKPSWHKLAAALEVSYPALVGQLRLDTTLLEQAHIEVMLDYIGLTDERQDLVRRLIHELSEGTTP